ncbi:uncharacterized protein LOC110881257 [Helianthus annuus]|uniref:uncharacterized protein LOC110881257 n=1 Tax=Helianthus annuus TaxID=4232 RepID=UPI0016533D6A|nr:uncharacterized protein LOC110881257 [Helianthus annuus]
MNTLGKRRGIVSSHETGESSTARSFHRQSRRQQLLNERVVHWSRAEHPCYTQCCKLGIVRLSFPIQPPSVIKQLFEESNFLENIRAYNSMFSMTSFGADIDETVNDGRGPYVFKISGQVSHWIGSLCPPSNEKPWFLQLYIYDTENEVSNRLRVFGDSTQCSLSADIVRTLNDVLTTHNKYVRVFKNAKEMADPTKNNYSVRLYNNVPDRRYGPPSPGTLGGIVCGDDANSSGYDIIVHSKDGIPQRVSKLHPCYMPLQYPLLFPFGEEGWSPRFHLHQVHSTKEKRLTVNMYYSYQIHDRVGVYSLLLHGGRLFQQYLVDAYTCIEQNRLTYYSTHQDQLRSEYIAGVYDALSRGDTESREIGKRIFLPVSFTGGPRYMHKHYQDALAICRVHGNPQYFITFTCNVKWPEITRYMDSIGSTNSQHHPDIIARVFKLKVEDFIKFMKADKTFGDVGAYLYTIEFQKRGLPHCHTLLWVTEAYKIQDAAAIDNYITAEFPDPQSEASLYQTITECMLHGPCGLLNHAATCMREGKCSKNFPKSFQPTTTFDKDGYVHYKRNAGIHYVLRSGIRVDNGYVVPYNKRLCSRFNAHINVEYCGWNMLIKYLFKYISKGVDRIRFVIQKSKDDAASTSVESTPIINEIQSFVDGRFICPHEACWRILNFPIHERDPAVQILAVHLENMQNVTFKENSRLQSIVNNPSFGKTTLTEWLNNNCKEPEGLHLRYSDYPSRFWWESSSKGWIRRARLGSTAIGRLVYIHPTAGELFYLRMLLCHQKGCKSYADIRTVAHVTYTK